MNRVKTKRKTVKRDAKRYSFSFEKSLINAFIEKAGECGYNTTEALEVLMQKATEGLLPKKESFVKKLTKATEESLMNGIGLKDMTFVINPSDVSRLEKELNEGSMVIKTTEPGGGPKTNQSISFNGIPVVTMDAIKNGEVATIVVNRGSNLTRQELVETLDTMGQYGLANHYREEGKFVTATMVLNNYLTKENLLGNVVEGPIIQEIFGSMKSYVKLNTFEVIVVDVETQQLTVFNNSLTVGKDIGEIK